MITAALSALIPRTGPTLVITSVEVNLLLGRKRLPMKTDLPENSSKKKEIPLFPTKLRRRQYLVRWLLWLVALGLAVALLAPMLAAPESVFWTVFVVALLFKVLALDIPRLKDAGMSPFLLLLFLVPGANLVMVILLFFAPSATAPQRVASPAPENSAPVRG